MNGRLTPASFTGLGTADHMYSLRLVTWCRKEPCNLRDVPRITTNMHKLTMEIRRFPPIKRRKFWSKHPNKVKTGRIRETRRKEPISE